MFLDIDADVSCFGLYQFKNSLDGFSYPCLEGKRRARAVNGKTDV